MTAQDVRRVDGDLGELFTRSPADLAHTAPAAEVAFVLGLLAVVVAPFSLTFGLSLIAAGLGVVLSVVGLAQASRTGAAGSTLAALGLVFALGALAMIGLRYAGLDTAFGDPWVPHLHSALQSLNDLVPTP
ncbi:MAG: hypothetical protein JOZ82_00510 [Marmoricola sp.]|nr:hypothetical protein [Marmoricola sp.]